MGGVDDLSPGQQEALLALMRGLADAELVAEEARCRLCETRSFDPTTAFACLKAGGRPPRGAGGCFDAYDLQGWLAGQPHAPVGASHEELASLLQQYSGTPLGEMRLEDFYDMVLPRSPANSCLRSLALARGAEASWQRMGEVDVSPEAALRFCRLLEDELRMLRKLQFHRRVAHDQSIHKAAVLRFLGSDRGLCAGLDGLLPLEGVKSLLADDLRALSKAQTDAMLRRAKISDSAAAFAFDDLATCLFPAASATCFLPVVPLASPTRSPPSVAASPVGKAERWSTPSLAASPLGKAEKERGARPWQSALDTSADGPTRLGSWASSICLGASPASPWGDIGGVAETPVRRRGGLFESPASAIAQVASPLDSAARPAEPAAPGGAIAPRLRDVGGPSELPGRSPHAAHDGSPGAPACSPGAPALSPCASPACRPTSRDRFGALADTPSPRRGSLRASSPTAGHSVGAHVRFSPPASPHGSREFRSPSWPAIQSPLVRPLSAPQVWRGEARERLVQAVLSTMARQAALDGEVEDARALAISFATAESVFDAMDRLKRGSVSCLDMCAFVGDVGEMLSAADFMAILREVRLLWSWDDHASYALLVKECLSLRDLCLLLCPADSPERAAAQGASSDDDLRSALYLLRNSEPCPTCTARVQRDADAAGCPNVTCPICRTTFRCFCVVGDPPVGTFACEFRPTALSMPARVRVSALLRALANVAEDAERERRKLAMLASYDGHGWADGCGLADVFNFFAGTQAGFAFGDLQRAFSQHGRPMLERELRLVWQRYRPSRSGGVSMSDFRRQLLPTCDWVTSMAGPTA